MSAANNNSNSREAFIEAYNKFRTEEFQETLKNITTEDIEEVEEVFMDLYGSYESLSDVNKKSVEAIVKQCLERIDTALKRKGVFKMSSMLNALSSLNMNSLNKNESNNNTMAVEGGRRRQRQRKVRKTRKSRKTRRLR